MTAIQPETAAGAFIQRHPDGRHAVMDQTGALLGLHNSHQSALRQMADYYSAPHQSTPQELAQTMNAQPMQPAHQAPAQAAQVPHAPTPQDMAAGMNFGAALIHAHPHANPDQLIAFAHQMGQEHAQNALGAYSQQQPMAGGQAGLQDKMKAQEALQGQVHAQTMPQPQPGQMQAMQGVLGAQGQGAAGQKPVPAPMAGGIPPLGPMTRRML